MALSYEGRDIGLLAKPSPLSRENIKSRLENLFPKGIQAVEFGSKTQPKSQFLLAPVMQWTRSKTKALTL